MSRYLNNLRFLSGIIFFMLIVHVMNILTGYALTQFGILPRYLPSLPYIFTAPFIHGSNYHLINNLVGLLIFGSLCLIRSKRYFIRSSIFIVTVGGALVWLFGRQAVHIGASGWIFGLWSLCIAIAWVDRRISNIVIAVAVILLYGGMIYGVLPGDPHVSFESHLFGALAGVFCALFLHKR